MSPVGVDSGMAGVQSRISEIQSRIASVSGRSPLPTSRVGASTGQSAAAVGASALAGGAGGGGGADFAQALGAATAQLKGAASTGLSAAAGGGSGASIVASAKTQLGVPYKWGGTSPGKGLDCSGLVQWAMKQNGIDVPRTSQQQARVGTAVPSLAQAKPGDLIVLSGGGHIGIYVGDNKMIHAPKAGDVVKISSVWEKPMTIRRLAPEASAPAAAPAAAAAVARPGSLRGAAPYQQMFDAATAKNHLPAGLLAAVAKAESNFNPRAVSHAGARGLMQIMPGTAKGLGVDPMNPAQAIDGAARLLGQHLKTYNGSVELALAAYNAGPGNVKKYGGIPPFTETQNYVRKVTATLAGRS